MSTEKSRNLGIDILCCFGVMLLLGLQYIKNIGYFAEPIISWAAAAPIAGRWLCLSGAMVLSAGTGYILGGKKFSMGYFRIFIRLVYVYIVCGLCAIGLRLTFLHEELSLEDIVQSFLQFTTTETGKFAGMYFGILLAAPFINAALYGLPNRQARFFFLCLTAAFGTLQPILLINGIYLLPEWCKGLFPVAAYIGGAYLKRYMKRRHVLPLLLILFVTLAVETVLVTTLSLPSGTLSCPWLDSMATLPCLGIALCLLGLFHSKKDGKGSVHRFFAGAAGGALAALLLGDPLLSLLMPSLLERFPDIEMRFWGGCIVIPLLFTLCCVMGLILQLPLLGIRSFFENAEVEEDEEERPEKKRHKDRSDVSMPERVHTRPSTSAGSSRHSIRVAVSEPKSKVRLTQPAEELPPGQYASELPERFPQDAEPEQPQETQDIADLFDDFDDSDDVDISPEAECPTMEIPALKPGSAALKQYSKQTETKTSSNVSESIEKLIERITR